MATLKDTASKLTVLMREAGIGKYAVSLTESEKRELNTEHVNFSLYRTIFDKKASVTAYVDGRKGSASGNGQADTTGEFMFGVTMGYEIKNGKLGRALLDTTISGVAFEMLKTVDMVGDSVVWSSSGFCGKKQPMPVGMGGPALRCKVMIGGR